MNQNPLSETQATSPTNIQSTFPIPISEQSNQQQPFTPPLSPPEQTTQPVSQSQPPFIPPTTVETDKQLNWKTIIISILVMTMFAGISYFGYTYYQSKTFSNTIKPKTNSYTNSTPLPPAAQSSPIVQSSPTHSLVAYINNENSKSGSNQVQIYNLDTLSLKPSIEILNQPNKSYSLGSWSPDGRYLPITTLDDLSSSNLNNRSFSFILYDSTNHTVKIIDHDHPLNDPIFSNKSHFYHTEILNHWLNNNSYGFNDEDRDSDQFHYFSIIDENFQSQARDSLKSTSPIKIIINPNNSRQVEVNDRLVIPTLTSNVVGLLNNQLITLQKPKGLDMSWGNTSSSEKIEQTYEEWKKQGLSEEEISIQFDLLVAPRKDYIILFTDVFSGEITKTINLPSKIWYTRSVQVHPTKALIIARQTNKHLQPDKERYVLIDPSQPDNLQVLLTKDSAPASNSAIGSLLLLDHREFYISSDGKWIVGLQAQTNELRSPLNTFALNLNTKKVLTICKDCRDPILSTKPKINVELL